MSGGFTPFSAMSETPCLRWSWCFPLSHPYGSTGRPLPPGCVDLRALRAMIPRGCCVRKRGKRAPSRWEEGARNIGVLCDADPISTSMLAQFFAPPFLCAHCPVYTYSLLSLAGVYRRTGRARQTKAGANGRKWLEEAENCWQEKRPRRADWAIRSATKGMFVTILISYGR